MKLLVIFAVLCVSALASPPRYYPAFQAGERVVGGSGAARDQFPYQLTMQWGILGIWQHICGAIVITTRSALTAAHCITESPTLGSFRVRGGILLLNDNLASMQTLGVQSHLINPNYAGGVNPHDIAILTVAGAFTFGPTLSPIALPAASSTPTGNAVLSGWGSTSAGGMPNQMQFVEKPIITLAECASALTALLGNPGPLDPTNVCTGPLTGGVSACSGDSGGPLAQGGVVVGIVSWGIMPCGTVGAPSVYVGVSHYIDWINNNALA